MWATAEQVCDPISNGSTPRAELMQPDLGEVPFIKVYNLTFDGSLDFTIKPTYISHETHRKHLKRSILFPGDVLTNIVGPPLGKVSIVPDTYTEWNMNQAIVAFRTNPSILDNHYLSLILLGDNITTQRLNRTAKATAGQFNLNVSTCRMIDLPLPPLCQQKKIVSEVERILSVIQANEEVITLNLARAERLRQAVLARAFRGELV